jgi:hypothetical protein
MKKKDWRRVFVEWIMKRLGMTSYHVCRNPKRKKGNDK